MILILAYSITKQVVISTGKVYNGVKITIRKGVMK